jgi:hypothetical protein
MGHPRKEIRQAVAAQISGETAAEDRVYTTREVPYKRGGVPAIAVYTPEEEVDGETPTAPRELVRSLQVFIEGVCVGGETVDDTIDDLAEEIETAMHADETLGGKAGDSILSRTETAVFEDAGKSFGLVRLVYVVMYQTYAPAEVSTPDDFLTADVRHSLSGAQATDDQAHDSVPVQE